MNRYDTERLHSALRKAAHKSRHLQMTYYHNCGDLKLLKMIARHNDGITPSTIAQKFEISLPTVSQKLTALEKQGLIERKNCEKDRRKTFVFATEKGIRLVEECYRQLIGSFSNVCEKLGEEKTSQLIRLLNEISEYIDAEIHREEEDK